MGMSLFENSGPLNLTETVYVVRFKADGTGKRSLHRSELPSPTTKPPYLAFLPWPEDQEGA